MIVSLVIFFNPASDGGGRPSAGQLGNIDGERISRPEYANAEREAMLAYFMSTGEWPSGRSNFDLQRETYIRLFFIKKFKDYNIYVSDEAVAQAANNILSRAGGGRPVPLEEFVKRALMPHATEQDFARYVRHELALQQLLSIVGLPGDLVTPQEARALFTRENQQIVSHALFYSGTNYQTSVAAATPEVLTEFYTNRLHLYELPERVQVHYVTFSASNFLAQADTELFGITNLNEVIEQEYQQRGTNAFPDLAPEQARQKLREERRHDQALLAAYRTAERFMDDLLSRERTPNVEDFLTAARTNNFVVQQTAPFDQENGPDGLDVGPNFAPTAFRLTEEEPLADRPMVGENAVFVIALAKRLPVETQSYDTVKDRVADDYRRTKAVENARRAGSEFSRVLQEGLKAGKTFSELVSQANLRSVAVEPLSIASTNAPQVEAHVPLPQYKQAAFMIEPGTATEFVPTMDGGFIVFVEKLVPLDESRILADLPEYTERFRRARRREAIDAWLQAEASKSLRETPLMQQQQQQQAPAGTGAARS